MPRPNGRHSEPPQTELRKEGEILAYLNLMGCSSFPFMVTLVDELEKPVHESLVVGSPGREKEAGLSPPNCTIVIRHAKGRCGHAGGAFVRLPSCALYVASAELLWRFWTKSWRCKV